MKTAASRSDSHGLLYTGCATFIKGDMLLGPSPLYHTAVYRERRTLVPADISDPGLCTESTQYVHPGYDTRSLHWSSDAHFYTCQSYGLTSCASGMA